jgi:hypothetical protein
MIMRTFFTSFPQRTMSVMIVQVINGMLGKRPQVLGNGLTMTKFFLGAKEDDRFVYVHKFRDILAHLARIVRDKQNRYMVLLVEFAQQIKKHFTALRV